MLPVLARDPWPRFPGGNGEVADLRLSFESTRRGRWPANSFGVSVTAPAGSRLVYWTTPREQQMNDGTDKSRAGRPGPVATNDPD
ncbi:hypothetical protein CGZ69_29545 [Streptomyces peucetius subsp. caesius ATCC 27952]|nr:hypothetical protein CGZ69_29545 [Streptomyces peucetius subsp. caesius ATCC 27952]